MAPVVLALAFMAPGPSVAAGLTRQVLILHSYQNDYEWTRLVNQGLTDELEGAPDLSCQIKAEYLDAKRAWGPELAEHFAAYLARRYEGFKPDIVVVSDNDAFEFMRSYGERLFGPVPWVFAGVNELDPADLAPIRGRVTGVVERIDYAATLRLVLELFPGTTEIRALADRTTTGPKTLAELREAAAELGLAVPVTAFPDLPFPELLKEAAGLSPDVAVFLLAYARDAAGDVWSMRDVASRMAAAAPGPSFAIWDFFFGHGVVGGAMTSGLAQGAEAGRMALRILRGADPAAVPVNDVPSPPALLDWRQLRRFGVPASRVPAAARVEFRPPELRERDPAAFWAVVGLSAVALALGASLLAISAAYRRVRASEALQAAALKEKEALLREVHHRVKNNFQVTASLLSLQAGSVDDERARAALLDSENRIKSMALVHAEAYEERDLSRVELGSFARSLVGSLLSSAPGAALSRFEVSGGPLVLDMERAIPLGLVLNELVTNSLKYAARGRGGCAIRLELRPPRAGEAPDGGPELEASLVYTDDGPGLPADRGPDNPKSLGLQLIGVLADQAGATLAWSPADPARFSLTLKARGRAAAGPSPAP